MTLQQPIQIVTKIFCGYKKWKNGHRKAKRGSFESSRSQKRKKIPKKILAAKLALGRYVVKIWKIALARQNGAHSKALDFKKHEKKFLGSFFGETLVTPTTRLYKYCIKSRFYRRKIAFLSSEICRLQTNSPLNI